MTLDDQQPSLDLESAAAAGTSETKSETSKRSQTSRRRTAVSTTNKTRRTATFNDLLHKPARSRELVLRVPNDDGDVIDLVVNLRAIGAKDYDDLIAKHPPTAEQKKEGGSYNVDTFAPALIAACSHEPKLTPNEAAEIWNSPDWSRGEIMELFLASVEVCSKGLDVPFTGSA